MLRFDAAHIDTFVPSALAFLVAATFAQHFRNVSQFAARDLLLVTAASAPQYCRLLARRTCTFVTHDRARVPLLHRAASLDATAHLATDWNGIGADFSLDGSRRVLLALVELLQRNFTARAREDGANLKLARATRPLMT